MTWVGLGARANEPLRYLELARRLVQQVHEVLGPPGDAEHPTARGLRIGKRLPERARDEPHDPQLEWDRDGQYYHYLTKWMHALRSVARATGDEKYRRWAIELAQAAHRAFAYPGDAPRRLYWKMSVDLSPPLVASMGMHDPLDGLVAAASLGLEREANDLARICARRSWVTDDALGAGGLLVDALRLGRLVAEGGSRLHGLFVQAVNDAATSVEAAAAGTGIGAASDRLAFRELGLALGLHAVDPLAEYADVEPLRPFLPLAEALEEFWLDPARQAARGWSEHRDINAVTLAATLAPEGALA